MIMTEGICKEYFGKQKVPSTTDICTLEYPIKVVLKDSFPLDFSTEMVALAIWGVCLVIIGLFLVVHHCLTIRKYRPLTEDDWDELKDVSKKSVISESKTKEVVMITE